MTETMTLPTAAIKIPSLLLREVESKTETYQLLVEDIKDHGIKQPLLVREVDVETGTEGVTTKAYYLIEGRQRLGAAEQLGILSVPVIVETCTDTEAQLTMMRMNLHRSSPAPAAYAKFLREILLRNNDMSFKTLADEINQTPEWIRERLKLTDLTPEYSALVDAGSITPLNGIALAKLPENEQTDFVDRAKTLTNVEFAKAVAERKKELDKARLACRTPSPEGFTAYRLLRSKADLNYLADADPSDPLIAQIINDAGATDAASAVKAAAAWFWQTDVTTVAKRRTVWEAEQARLKEEKDRTKAANAAKREAADADKAAAKAEKDAADIQRKVVMS